MFKLLAILALMFCAYLGLLTWAPPVVLLAGFVVAGHFIAYWWCGLAALGYVAHRSI
jgi:hypothetical protein